MNKKILFFISLLFLLCGCHSIGSKSLNMVSAYSVTFIISLITLVIALISKVRKNKWLLLVFISVTIINLGYLLIAISPSLSFALNANRIAYFGSVFLPLSMLMILFHCLNIKVEPFITYILIIIAIIIFMIAASPGYLDIYYKDVSIVLINGAVTLQKEYGPLHCIYLVYLLVYFSSMIYTIIYSMIKNKTSVFIEVFILGCAVFVNIGVWLLEQLIYLEFEILSLSYIMSELFLLGVFLLQEQSKQTESNIEQVSINPLDETGQSFIENLKTLTPTEMKVLQLYVEGYSSKEIIDLLSISINTLKFHNKNIYSKLNVSSRKQLLQWYEQYKDYIQI